MRQKRLRHRITQVWTCFKINPPTHPPTNQPIYLSLLLLSLGTRRKKGPPGDLDVGISPPDFTKVYTSTIRKY